MGNTHQTVSGLEIKKGRALIYIDSGAPCSYALKKGPCKFCAFWNKKPDSEGILLETAVEKVKKSGCSSVELLGNGSAFDTAQYSEASLKHILQLFAQIPSIKSIMLESRPEYIVAERVRTAKSLIGNKKLEIAIGLETANDTFRDFLGKGFSLFDFYDAAITLAKAGASPVAYLLTFGSPEIAACSLFDSAYTVKKLQERLNVPIRLAVEPYFQNTGLGLVPFHITPELMAEKVLEIVKKLGMAVTVATSSENCGIHPLTRKVREFDLFNTTQNVRYLEQVLRGRCQ